MDDIQKEKLRQKFYAESPWDLASEDDDKYRDAIDAVLDSDFVDNLLHNANFTLICFFCDRPTTETRKFAVDEDSGAVEHGLCWEHATEFDDRAGVFDKFSFLE